MHGEVFRSVSEELQAYFANDYVVVDENGQEISPRFKARLTTTNYKDYIRRILKTTEDASFLEEGQCVINVLDPENRMKIEGKEKKFIGGTFIHWIVYLSSVPEDPLKRIVRNL
jgi:hypothetical protein